MSSNFNDDAIIGLACCGIYYAKDNLNNIIHKAEQYIRSFVNGEINFPFFNLTTEIKLRCNSSSYSLQVAPISPNNDYAVINGNAYVIFKVMEKKTNYFQLIWNGQKYLVFMEKKLNSFQFSINKTSIVLVDKIDYPILQSSVIKFPINSNIQTNELNSILDLCLFDLNNILNGYVLPEPFFSNNMYLNLEKIFNILRDPLLPALQFQRYLESCSSILPTSLVNELQQIIGQYSSNFSSLFSRFPSNKVKLLIEKYLQNIDDNISQYNMGITLSPLLELAEMYSDGIRGNVRYVLEKLLRNYLAVEIKFQDDETVSNANLTNKQVSVADLISHNVLSEKNKLILTLFEFLEKFLPGIISDLKFIIQKLLMCLNGNQYSQLIPKLREVLIIGQIPSYEIRKNEMESIFLNSINGSSNCVQTNRLENLICSNSEVFDIISDFFYHKKTEICRCAMEVYVRRAYMVYEICSFEQSQLSSGELCVLFKFYLPTNNKRRNLTGNEIKRSNSYVSIVNNKGVITRKSSQTGRNQIFPGYVEKEDISDGELSNEDYFQPYIVPRKSNGYDTDSAISVGTFSLSELSAAVSEQVDSDCVLDNSCTKFQLSPSIHSLDTLWVSPSYSSFKDHPDNVKSSNGSLDKLSLYKHNRRTSMCSNNPSSINIQNFSGRCDLGFMVVFNTLDEVEKNLFAIQQLLSIRNSTVDEMDFHEYDMSYLDRKCSPAYKVILKVILRDPQLTNKCDNDVAVVFFDFCDKHLSFLDEIQVVRITFLLQSSDKTIRYFTFRYRGHFEEDIKLRNIDPILSFQLEINRLRNYHLERLPVPNRRMYVYMGTCKEITEGIQYRMFARCIIHHRDFNLPTSNIDYVAKEAEKNLIEAMDAFDMAWIDERANLTNSNHIFFYFHSILCINKIDELENVVRTIIFKYGRRLWNLKILQAELKMSVKVNNGPTIPIRLWVHNEGGKSLDICIYKEEFQFKTDHKTLVSWSLGKEGRYHGVPVDCFYST